MSSISFLEEPQVPFIRKLRSKDTIEESDEWDPNTWAKSSTMKGAKLSAHQNRQKQALKTLSIKPMASRNYTTLFAPDSFFEEPEVITTEQSKPAQPMNRRNGYSADPTYKSRRRKVQQEMENIRSRTMMVTSSNAPRSRSKTLRSFQVFNSGNLGTRMNEYMNMFIRQGHPALTDHESTLGSSYRNDDFFTLGADSFNSLAGVIPHKKKLTNFEKKAKRSKKAMMPTSCLNKGKEDVRELSKTLNLDIFKSPLVSNLQQKGHSMRTALTAKKAQSKNPLF